MVALACTQIFLDNTDGTLGFNALGNWTMSKMIKNTGIVNNNIIDDIIQCTAILTH